MQAKLPELRKKFEDKYKGKICVWSMDRSKGIHCKNYVIY